MIRLASAALWCYVGSLSCVSSADPPAQSAAAPSRGDIGIITVASLQSRLVMTQRDSLLARLALLVLQEGAKLGEKHIDAIRLQTDKETSNEIQVELAEAVLELSRLAKPLDCSGDSEGSVLLVKCGPIEDADRRYLYAQRVLAAEAGRGFLGAIRSGYLQSDTDLILVSASKASIVMTFADFRQWFRDYLILDDVGFSGRLPTTAELSRGVRHTVDVRRVEDYRGRFDLHQ